MPHYFFDLADDKIVHDFKGKQLRAGRGTRIDHRSGIRDYQGDTFARAHFDWSVTVKDGKFITDAAATRLSLHGTFWPLACLTTIADI